MDFQIEPYQSKTRSRRLSGRLGNVLGSSWRRLGASWGRLGGRLGGVLGHQKTCLGGVLGGVLGCLEASENDIEKQAQIKSENKRSIIRP